ncbi:Gfo/Idh/MocA family oxidoreductase [Mycobacterium sp. MYCO198283]|uniref:Gfo/Idh/MocA family protein n=1 Tax=Mycobacterium sp. MYCO198283 TaxID=2883505 RepID=UPI001E4FA97C|nr:Gfo/Idh/MocA family oxidoreductase [Mycobacterium sp. MYCO198283]MCG5431789.1 Gfo/Idh/MocA family oxidoreductase [Mycobacterium sp. MYCO198283]
MAGTRWGIAGFGWVARDYMAPAIAAAGGTLVAVADPSPRARAAAEAAGIAAYDDAGAMLARGDVDLLYVATPNNAHLPPVLAACAAGVPVLCEKPMAATLADAEAIAAAVTDANVLYGTAFDQRHHPAHRRLAELIADGAVGRPLAVRIVYACWVGAQWSADGSERPNWRVDPTAAGGGAVIDLALHGLDLTQLLVGQPLQRLHIDVQQRLHSYPVDDGGVLSGRTTTGVLVSSHVAYNCCEQLPRRRLEVLGESGLLTAVDTMGQTAGGTLTLTRDDGADLIGFGDASPFTAQAAAFQRAAAGEPHDFSITRDLDLMRLFDRAYKEACACR